MSEQPSTGKAIVASRHGENTNGNNGDVVREIPGGPIADHKAGVNGDGRDDAFNDLVEATKALGDAKEGGNPDQIAAAREALQSAEDRYYGFESSGDPEFDEIHARPEFYRELEQLFQEGLEKGEWAPGDPTTPEGREIRQRFFAERGQRQFLAYILADGQTFEIRAIFGPNDAKSRICHNADEAIAAAKEFESAKGIYFTLNPLRADLTKPAKDLDVTKRHLLLIDADPTRSEKGELSSTKDEKEAAAELTGALMKWLMVRGWPWPIIIDSGNGGHLLFRIDLPNDQASHDLVKAVLTRLAKRFNTDRAKVDTTVHNAARISKFPYTMVRKGPDTSERPHRMAQVIHCPESVEIVSREKLEALVEDLHDREPAREAKPDPLEMTVPRSTAKSKGQSGPMMTRDEYGQAELKKEIDQFAAAQHPGRHADLLRCSLSLAGLVAAGVLGDQDAIRGLYSAARDNGMEGEGRLGEVAEAWRSAMLKADARAMPHHVVEPTRNGPVPSSNGPAAKAASKLDLSWVSTDFATLADADKELQDTNYAWERWVPRGSITAVVADPGVGKTRIVAEWCKRLWYKEGMPDGATTPFSAGTKSLWLCYDRNWRGLVRSFTQFGVPRESVILPTRKGKPLWIPDFDKPETMDVLREFIDVHKPGWLVVDTTTYASIYNTGKPNEAKLAYDPVMDVLMNTGCACLGLTHTNREGGVLNRRFLERCRVKIEITRPDPSCKERLRLEVTKSDDKYPPALGATFTDTAVVYDTKPPESPEAPKRGRKPSTSPGLAEFLWEYLQTAPAFVVDIVKAARDKGLLKAPTDQEPKPSISPLYDAKDWVTRHHPGKIVDQFEMESSKGRKLKAWQIIDATGSQTVADPAPTIAHADDDDYTKRDW